VAENCGQLFIGMMRRKPHQVFTTCGTSCVAVEVIHINAATNSPPAQSILALRLDFISQVTTL
jgi:hypothetical protein